MTITADIDTVFSGRERIEQLTRDKLSAFTGLIRDDGTYKDRIYESASSASRHVATDYGRRFLIELIQNAYDAHPAGRSDGRITVVLRNGEGAYGTLYVANDGAGFTLGNVEALCDLGLSNKPPGETIGNKGLGFRSVHHISDDPQIFSSASTASAALDGYCFRFANHDDLDFLLDMPRHRELAKRDLPLFHTPVWIDQVPDAAQRFAREGFVTVIRLPLRGSASREAVREAFEDIRQMGVPLNLFLPRVRWITFCIENAGGEATAGFPFVLSREVKDRFDSFTEGTEGEHYEVVELQDERRFFIACRSVAEDQIRDAIADSIDAKELHESWGAWRGCGEVAVAVALGAADVAPRLYTFLPMGQQAAAPFHGHLHGSFFPKSDRTSLKASIALNRLLIEAAAPLAARAALWLAHSKGILGAPTLSEAAAAAVDLVTWSPETESLEGIGHGRLPALVRQTLATATDCQHMLDVPILPCWDGAPGRQLETIAFRPARAAREWTLNLPAFPEQLVAWQASGIGLHLLWSGLGAERVGRLRAFLTGTALRILQFDARERAALAEAVAIYLHAQQNQAAIKAWTQYYQDLPALVGAADGASLFGRKILLCSDGRLNRVEQDDAATNIPIRSRRRGVLKHLRLAVFSPSDRLSGQKMNDKVPRDLLAEEDPLRPPESLAQEFAFLSDRMDWYNEPLTRTRQYLEASKLVKTYAGDEVLAHVSDIVAQDTRKSARREALLWAFRLWRGSLASQRPLSLKRARLFVPNRDDDYIDARSAVFGSGWPEPTRGPVLEEFLRSTAVHSGDLRSLHSKLLAFPESKPFSRKMLSDWTDFLRQIGVQCGLQPIARDFGSNTVEAWRLRSFDFCTRMQIPEAVRSAWQAHVEESVPSLPSGRGAYRLNGDIWLLPGQDVLAGDHLAPEARELLAILIAQWFATFADLRHVTVSALNPNRYQSRQDWPTPLSTFLKRASWIPLEWPLADGSSERRHLRCDDVWLGEDQSERLPTFLPQLSSRFRRALVQLAPDRLAQMVQLCGLRVLNRPTDLWAQADYLARLYKAGAIRREDVRAFLKLYNHTWALLAEAAAGTSHAPVPMHHLHLLVRQGGGLRVVDISSETGCTERQSIYVRDSTDDLAGELAAAAGLAVFDAGPLNAPCIATLVRSLGEMFVPVSDAGILAFADGVDINASLAGGSPPPGCVSIVQICPWLPLLLLLSLEALTGLPARRIPADRRDMLDRLAEISVWPAQDLTFRVGSEVVSVPHGARQALLVTVQPRHVVVGGGVQGGVMTWPDLTRMLPQLGAALQLPEVAADLRSLFAELEKQGRSISGPVEDDIVPALGKVVWLKPDAVLGALDPLNAPTEQWLPWLEAIVHYCAGDPARASFAESVRNIARDATALKLVLASHLIGRSITADQVIAACRQSRTPGQLRDYLQLDFGPFNESLRAAGLPPETFPALHLDSWATFVETHLDDILMPIRNHFAAQWALRQPAAGYLTMVDAFNALGPDAEWLEVHRTPPEPACLARVEAWLLAQKLNAMGTNPADLPPLRETKAQNTDAIRRFANKAGEVIRAWCAVRSVQPQEVWREPLTVPGLVFAAMEAAGAVHYRPLTEADAIDWAAALGIWPDGMPVSLDLAILGLRKEAVEKQRQNDNDRRDQKKQQLRSFVFDGNLIDPREVDRQDISAKISTKLSRAVLGTPLGEIPGLIPLPPLPRSGHPSQTNGGGGAATGRMSREKTEMIGYMGEVVVYHWLKAKLRTQDIDAAWVSSNREDLLLSAGSDSHGYDFKIRYRSQPWLLEVKASLGDPCQFDMGETEVRAARDALLSRPVERYWIVYVSNLANPAAVRIEMLPNPLSPESTDLLRVRGEGLRYEFRRS